MEVEGLSKKSRKLSKRCFCQCFWWFFLFFDDFRHWWCLFSKIFRDLDWLILYKIDDFRVQKSGKQWNNVEKSSKITKKDFLVEVLGTTAWLVIHGGFQVTNVFFLDPGRCEVWAETIWGMDWHPTYSTIPCLDLLLNV